MNGNILGVNIEPLNQYILSNDIKIRFKRLDIRRLHGNCEIYQSELKQRLLQKIPICSVLYINSKIDQNNVGVKGI